MTTESQTSPPEDSTPSFPIVAIGSSAGGLQALEAFFEALPEKFPACFVVAEHFPENHQSHLAELLSTRTRRRVEVASEGSPLEVDRVWVLPPGQLFECGVRSLQAAPGSHSHSAPVLVDTLLRSLAKAHPTRAVAVILSGTGSDGALGAREVKDAGGLVMAQSPQSARFPGMPQSAILTGTTDVTGTPEELARCLQEFSSPSGSPPPDPFTSTAGMRLLESLLKRHAGFNLGDYKPESVSRRIERRMGLCHIDEFELYVSLLQKNPAECENLAKDMLISVTGFFRDPEVFARLRETVLPRLVKESRGRPLRVWVPGCATGEEAYTIAMLLDDTLADCNDTGPGFKIFATDLDRHALEIASQGLYPAAAAAPIPEPLRRRYFLKEADNLLIVRQIRERMVFAKHNILKDPPFNRLDLVSCRNLLIYLQPHAQQRVLSMVHFALRQGGVLVMGLSETVGDMAEDFGAVDHKQHIFHKKTHSPSMLPETIPIASMRGGLGPLSTLPTSPPILQDQSNARLLEAFTDRILGRFDRICFVLNHQLEILYTFGNTSRHIGLKNGRASMNLADLLPKNLSAALYTAAARVLAEEKPCRFGPIPADDSKDAPATTLLVESLRPATDSRIYLLVFLEDSEPGTQMEESSIGLRESIQRIGDLEEELRASRSRLKAAVEELEASNEELQTSNEELQASNEELQSANEELESVNEELQTLNNEHQFKILELTNAKEDLDNFIASADMATIFLDADLRIRRFTPGAARLTGLLTHDIGRVITALSHPLLVCAAEAARRILAGSDLAEFNLPVDSGGTIHLRALPFLAKTGARAGATISIVPIGAA
jgi:two-component system, chemotaxis family, CheB/CheR fusion protein